MRIRILVVDSQALARCGTAALLRQAADVEIVGEAASGREAIELVNLERPHVVIIEPQLPEGDGLETIRAIRHARPDASVLVLTQGENPEDAVRALEAGAVGYVLKDIEPQHLLSAVRHLASGNAMLNPRIARYVLDRLANGNGTAANPLLHRKRLTARELGVLELVADGLSDREIGGKLFLSEATVKTHVKAIYRKLGVRNRAHAAAFAALVGLVQRTAG